MRAVVAWVGPALVSGFVALAFACAGGVEAPPPSTASDSLEIARLKARDRVVVIRTTRGEVVYELSTEARVWGELTLDELRELDPEMSQLVEYGYARGASPSPGAPYLDASRSFRSPDSPSRRSAPQRLMAPAAEPRATY